MDPTTLVGSGVGAMVVWGIAEVAKEIVARRKANSNGRTHLNGHYVSFEKLAEHCEKRRESCEASMERMVQKIEAKLEKGDAKFDDLIEKVTILTVKLDTVSRN